MKLSIVFSFFNEEKNLPILIDETKKAVNTLIEKKYINDYEVIFVNDDSKDKSTDKIKQSQGLKYKLINMTRNFGNMECILAGFHNAQGDIIVYLDSDLQDPPRIIVNLVEEYIKDKSYDVIHTHRTKRHGETGVKKFISRLGYSYLNKSHDFSLPANCGDFKLITRKVVNEIIKLDETYPFVRGIIGYFGFKEKKISYERDKRFDGKENSKFKLNNFRMWKGHLDRTLVQFSDLPLKLIFLFGMISGLTFVIYFIFVFGRVIFLDYYTPISVIILAIIGISFLILTSVGILGFMFFKFTLR